MALLTDHIIYAASDLDVAMTELEQLLGARPYFGGQHLGRGSHNALLSLGSGVYLEVIAPDPNQPEPVSSRSFGLDRLESSRLVTWAVRTSGIEQTVQSARQQGYDPGSIEDGGRVREDGVRLAWRSTRRPEAATGQTPPGDWLIPFVIDWGETLHPSAGGSGDCQLIGIQLFHPEPLAIEAMLNALDVKVAVQLGDTPRIVAELETPNGRVELR